MAVAGIVTNAILASSAMATLWNVDEVLGGSSGFGASLFHDASGSNAMSGAVLANISGAGMLGTFNDVTGQFSGTFNVNVSSGPSFSLSSSNLIFGGGGFGTLDNNSSMTLNFANGSLNGESSPATIGFLPGYICCGNTENDPNTFNSDGMGGAIMTLWGADGFDVDNYGIGSYFNSNLGMDFRVHLTEVSAVPLPASLPLMMSALVGLGYLGRRRKKAAIA